MITEKQPGNFWVVLISFYCFFCFSASAQEDSPNLDEWKKALIDLSRFQNERTPKELLKSHCIVKKGMFDPGLYLSAFKRLSMEEGFELDFVYDYQEMGGHPVVYARKRTDVPFGTLAEFKKVHPRSYFIGSEVRYDPAFLGKVKTDGTPDGFLQLASLVLLGEQFFIHWHAIYEVMQIIPDRESLKSVAGDLPLDVASMAMSIDPTPKVIMDQEKVQVRYVAFSPWSGFTETEWVVSKNPPHIFIRVKNKIIVPYRNPLRF